MSICLISSCVPWEISERHDNDFDMLSTPSSFHCCLSQDSITCICLSPLLSSVLLEWCSSVLPPNLVKRELASTPTLSLDFLTVQETDSEALIARIPHGYQCDYQLRIAELLSEIEFLRTTGRRLLKSCKGRDNPIKDQKRLQVSKHTCFMSEVQI